MSIIPFPIDNKSTFLIAGAGGGYDFLCGLPIILELESKGCKVIVANYSFTNLQEVKNAKWHNERLLKINDSSFLSNSNYFPELFLSRWYRSKGIEKSIWCLARGGVKPTLLSYNYLIEKFDIDTVLCIDGGVDGIFRGDEYDLGTPSMDSISVISTSLCHAIEKIYVCTAFGTEGAEGKVSHAQALNRMSDLIKENALVGVSIINGRDDIGREFVSAIQYIFNQTEPLKRSIIISTLLASIEGVYGKISVHPKTEYSPPWISPLTSLLWFFNAQNVAKMKLFYEESILSEEVSDVAKAIDKIRNNIDITSHESIPI